VADEVQAPAGPFALGTHARVREPDCRHQVRAGEFGQHPGVDPVGLAGKRRQPLHLLRVRDLDLPARELEPVVHEAGAVHRLDRREHLLAVAGETIGQAAQTVGVRRRRTHLDGTPVRVEQATSRGVCD